ncbi:unnamed protein product, partial [Ilex paraguariensis]
SITVRSSFGWAIKSPLVLRFSPHLAKEQDAIEARHQLNAKLAKINGLTMDHQHRTAYKTTNDLIK